MNGLKPILANENYLKQFDVLHTKRGHQGRDQTKESV